VAAGIGLTAGFYLSIGNAWVFAVEIPRRAAQKSL